MLIQSRADLFKEIQKMIPKTEPYIVETDTGYFNCFDKDWLLMKVDDSLCGKIVAIVQKNKYQCVLAVPSTCSLLQFSVSDNEKVIFIRNAADTHEITWGASSYLQFKGVDNDKNTNG